MGDTAKAEDGNEAPLPARNEAPLLKQAVLDYNRLLDEISEHIQRFASRHEFIASHCTWIEANLTSAKVPIIRGIVGQAQKQQEDSLKVQVQLLRQIGDLLWDIQNTPGATQSYREGELKVARGLRLNGQDVDLYTLEPREGYPYQDAALSEAVEDGVQKHCHEKPDAGDAENGDNHR